LGRWVLAQFEFMSRHDPAGPSTQRVGPFFLAAQLGALQEYRFFEARRNSIYTPNLCTFC
jgi:hypothetical protein